MRTAETDRAPTTLAPDVLDRVRPGWAGGVTPASVLLAAVSLAVALQVLLSAHYPSSSPGHLLTGRVFGTWRAEPIEGELAGPPLVLALEEDLALLDRVPASLTYESRALARGTLTWGSTRAAFTLELDDEPWGVWLVLDAPLTAPGVPAAAPFERVFLWITARFPSWGDTLVLTPEGGTRLKYERAGWFR